MKNIDIAIKYSTFGWYVFPIWGVKTSKSVLSKPICQCHSNHRDNPESIGKHPIPKKGHLEATRDLKQIEKWWIAHPEANIGIATGLISGIVVLDVDKKNNGSLNIQMFPEIPPTVEAVSGSGGSHYFFKYNKEIKSSISQLAPGIDIKSDGGYIIVEPSKHKSGGSYEWITDQSPFEIELAEAPEWMIIDKKKIDYTEKEMYNEGERDIALISMGGKLRVAGLKDNEILLSLHNLNKERCNPPLNDKQVVKIFNSCLKYKENENKKQGKLATIVDIMKNDKDLSNLFKYNMFTKDIEYSIVPSFSTLGISGKILSDNDFIEIKYYISKKYNLEIQIPTIIEASVLMSLQNKYHPIRDWINSIKWDGVNRIDSWLIDYCGCENNAYIRSVGRKILCASIARLYDPGHKFDFMMILEGDQGIGKSQLVEALGGHWYLDADIKDRNKDTVDKIRGAWIVEISELVGFNRGDVESLKAFISRRTDRERLAYRRTTEDFPRQCIFIGTHNPSGDNTYFYDDTGNRRFWPVSCKFTDYEGVQSVRDQLFAEAKVIWESGVNLYLDKKEESNIAKMIQQDRLPSDPWQRSIELYCKGRSTVIIDELLKNALHIPLERQNRGHQIKVGQIMRHLGFTKKRESGNNRNYYYEMLINSNVDKIDDWEE